MGFVDTESHRTEELFGVSANPSDPGKLPVLDGVRYISKEAAEQTGRTKPRDYVSVSIPPSLARGR